MMAVAIVW